MSFGVLEEAHIVLSGYLEKRSPSGWNTRFVVLTKTQLLYFDSHDTLHKCKGGLVLNPTGRVNPSSSAENAIRVNCDGQSMPLAASTPEEINRWAQTIEFIISSLATHMAGLADENGVICALANRVPVCTEVAGVDFVLDPYYQGLQPIGYGSYGVVCRAVDSRTREEVAIKKVAPVFNDLLDTRRLTREVRVLRTLTHPCIIKISDLVPPINTVDFRELYIVTELMDSDLHRIIHAPRPLLTVDHVRWILFQMLSAIRYIHSAAILHRDLKPSNVLVNRRCDIKLCDFGLAREINASAVNTDSSQQMSEYVVTRWYRAPEIMLASGHYTTGVDIWGIGCIMGEMLLKEPLFPGTNYMEQLRLISQVIGKPSVEDLDFVAKNSARCFMQALPWTPPADWQARLPDIPAEATNLLQRMLVINPRKRITVEEALHHPFLLPLHRDYSYLLTDAADRVDMTDIHSAPLEAESMRQIIISDMVQIRRSGMQYFVPPAQPLQSDGQSMTPHATYQLHPSEIGPRSGTNGGIHQYPHEHPYGFAHPPPEGYACPSFRGMRFDTQPADESYRPTVVQDDIDNLFTDEFVN